MYESMSTYPNGLFDQLDRLQREITSALGGDGAPSSIRSVAAGTHPAINVGRTPDSFEVYAFAPGIDPSRLDVTVDRGVLRISGERESAIPKTDPPVQVYARERLAGRFSRALSLPAEIDPGKVAASYRDGVLRVSIGVREAARPQRIAVQ
jgi:HSP20 family protein